MDSKLRGLRRWKVVLIVMSIIITVPVLWFFGFFKLRNYTFAIECRNAEHAQRKHFKENRESIYEFAAISKAYPPIAFEILSPDTISIYFQDSSINYSSIFIDSSYIIRRGRNAETEFRINGQDHLEVIMGDTIEVTNHNWQVSFDGYYKDPQIDNLLEYEGWKRGKFNRLVEKVQGLECRGFSSDGTNFLLSYKIVIYEEPTGIISMFRHQDGFFDYLYTTTPDEFYWQTSLKHYEGNFYGISHWSFF